MAKIYPTLASIDLGSGKVAVLICEMAPQGLEVIGFGQSESHGVRKGVVVNIESSVMSLQTALDEARKLAGREIDYAVAGVTGGHIQTLASHGMVPLREKEVRTADVQRVIETASAVSLPLDREVIQIVPQEFVIDGQDGIQEPVGMYGKRLEVDVQVITGSITALENIRRVLQKVGLKAHHFISNPLASSRAVVSGDEREAGVCVVDIGSATTDIAVFQLGTLKWIRSLPIGGIHLTNDLAVGLKTHLKDAEEIKIRYGALASDNEEEQIEIPGLSGHEPRWVKRRILSTILQPRLDEILLLVRNELAKEGVDESLPSGIVLTGGVAHMKGVLEAAERVFRLPVRLGHPKGLAGVSDMVSSPTYATLVGLMQLGFEESEDLQALAQIFDMRGMKKVQAQVSRWMRDFF